MRFSHAHLLLLLYGIPVLAFLIFWKLSARARMLKRYGDLRLLAQQMESFSFRKRIIKWVIIMVALVLFILTGSGPQWGTKLEHVTRRGVDVIFALDVSESMLAEDVKPDRLAMAKGKVAELLERLAGHRVALVLFSGDSYVQCPPTLDISTFRLFLDVVDTDMISLSGTDFKRMLDEVILIFEKERKKFKALIILSDGEDHGKDIGKKIEELRRQGTVIHVLGVGTEKGGPIPVRRKEGRIVEYKKDKEGKAVMTKVKGSFLQSIALEGGGLYAQATQTGGEIKKVANAIQKMEKEDFSARLHSLLEDRFQYPLGALILVLILECLITTRRPEKKK